MRRRRRDLAAVVDRQAELIRRQHEQIVQLSDACEGLMLLAAEVSKQADRLATMPEDQRSLFWRDQAEAAALEIVRPTQDRAR